MKLSADAFVPKSVLALRNYSLKKFLSDLMAGITVGLVALPLAMAFSISSGLKPEAGLYCAVVAGFIISALGGSMAQIGGPTGAFVVVVASINQEHKTEGLFMCTLIAGVMLAMLGITGLGVAIKYIPRPVVIGFTNGIAVLIASTQIKDFLGLTVDAVPGDFLGRLEVLSRHLGTYNPQALALGTGAIVLILLMIRFAKKVPGSIAALVLGTAAAWSLGMPVETIADRFGSIPSGLPHFQVPAFRPDLIQPLMGPALTVMMLGAIESLLSAVVADRMTGDRHNPNVELFAQGVANIMSPLAGGLPATGAIARTATNIRSGAKTPVAGMIHALTLLAVLLFGSKLANHIPLCVLSAILFVVAYNMGEWREIREILKLSKADIAVWLITFTLTVVADLTVAVEAGMIMAALLYIQKVTSTTTVSRVTQDYIDEGLEHSLQANPLPDGVAVYRIHGPFLFGASDKLSVIEDEMESLPRVVMLRLRNTTALDGTGLQALERLADKLHESGRELVLCGVRGQPLKLLRQAEFAEHLGAENIQPSLAAAIVRAKVILAEDSEAS